MKMKQFSLSKAVKKHHFLNVENISLDSWKALPWETEVKPVCLPCLHPDRVNEQICERIIFIDLSIDLFLFTCEADRNRELSSFGSLSKCPRSQIRTRTNVVNVTQVSYLMTWAMHHCCFPGPGSAGSWNHEWERELNPKTSDGEHEPSYSGPQPLG